jgi:S-DNA-T family DNA segregation ATPase FtsK/SpoIIIE
MVAEAELRPHLTEASGSHAGRKHPLPFGEHILGRGGDAAIVLDHPDVSRRHARLEVGPDGVTVHDLGSKNGIYVEGRRVEGSVHLAHGDSFAFGDLELTISHPASQVSRALARAGETTVTTARAYEEPPAEGISLVLPLVGVVIFGGLVVALLLL